MNNFLKARRIAMRHKYGHKYAPAPGINRCRNIIPHGRKIK
jgi:hypothetical protein